MSVSMNGSFRLESRHFMYGLTAEDYAATSFADARIIRPDELPHRRKVASFVPLSGRELEDRRRAVLAIAKKHCPEYQSETTAYFSQIDSTGNSKYIFPLKSFFLQKHVIQNNRLSIQDSSALRHGKQRAFLNINGKIRGVALPESFDKADSNTLYRITTSVLVGTTANDKPINRSITELAGLKQVDYRGKAHPTMWSLLGELHEMVHASQAAPVPETEEDKYWSEMDADATSRDILKKTGQADDVLSLFLGIRFITIFISADRHCVAPDSALIEKGEQPMGMKKALQVRDNLALAMFGDIKAQVIERSGHTRMATSLDLAQNLYRTEPAALFSCLMKNYIAGSFRKNPHADSLALNILNAVELIAPTLLKPSSKSGCAVG